MNEKPEIGKLIAYRIFKTVGELKAENVGITYITPATTKLPADCVVITQEDAVLIHMMQYQNITDSDVRRQYGIGRLPSRIHDLKKLFLQLYPSARIDTVMEKNGYGKRYARYFLHDRNDEVQLPEVCKQLEW